MSADLIWAINSLLRPRQQTTLGPPKVRDPIPARLGVADWGVDMTPPDPANSCAPVLSGIYSITNYVFGDVFLPPPAEEGTTQHYAFVDRDDDGSWIANAFSPSTGFDNHFAHPTEGPYRFPNSLASKKAGLFTGEMKRVVQLLAGQNDEIPYGYQWSKTHGIYINQISGSRWVVEIDSNGVTVWPLSEVSISCPSGPEPDIWRVPVPVADLSSVPGKISLCNAAYLADIYDNGGPLLGGYLSWAFSASGHEAQVVISYSGFGPGNAYSKSFRYKLVFAADNNGDPTSVTLTLEQEGYVWNRDVQKNVRAPAMSTCGPSHPLALYSTGLPDPPIEGEFSFPVTVFYIGETEQVFTFNVQPLIVEDGGEATATPLFDPSDCNSFLYDPDYIGIDIYSDRSRIRTIGGATISGIPWAETEVNNSFVTQEYTHTRFDIIETAGPGCCLNSQGAAPWGIYGSRHKLQKVVTRYPIRTKLYQFCLVFPWFEREAYLFQEQWIDEQLDPIIEYTSVKNVFGTSWHNSGSNAGPQNWNVLDEEVYCFAVPAFYKYLGNCSSVDPTPPVAITDYVPWQSTVFCSVTSGPDTCCNPVQNVKFVTYGVGDTSTRDDVCDDETEISPSIDTNADLFRGKINAAGVGRTVSIPSDLNTFFGSGLFDDLGACSLFNSDPFWFGVWVDAFTGAGWLKHEGYGETDMQPLNNADTLYPMMLNMPASAEFSGWFGVPFPHVTAPS